MHPNPSTNTIAFLLRSQAILLFPNCEGSITEPPLHSGRTVTVLRVVCAHRARYRPKSFLVAANAKLLAHLRIGIVRGIRNGPADNFTQNRVSRFRPV
jgi:hypothetical protein